MKADSANKQLVSRFFRYVSFSVAAMAAMSCYILADTFFVSLGLGTDGLAALNFALPVYYFMHGAGLMAGMGGSTAYSVASARGDTRAADSAFTHSMIIGAAIVVVLLPVGIFLSPWIARLLGASGDTLPMTEIYIKVLLLFSPAFVFNNIIACFVRNDGAPRLAMLSMIAGSFSNIVLDYVFIFPCGMGMFGAVFATGLAPVIGLAVNSFHFIRRKNNFRPVKIRPQFRQIGRLCALGAPSLVEQFSSAAVILAFNFIILGTDGESGVAAYGIVANISLVVVAVFTGVAQGVQPLVSRAHGENDGQAGKRLLAYSVIFALAFSVVVYIVIFAFAFPIADIFNSGNDPALTSTAANGMRIYFTAIQFLGFNVIACTYLTASERPVPAQVISLLRGLIVIIPAALLLSHFLGITGAWLSYPVTELLVAVVSACVLFVRRK